MNDVKEKIIKNKTPLIIGGVVGLFIGIYGTSHYYQSEYAKLSAFTNMFGLGDIVNKKPNNNDEIQDIVRNIKKLRESIEEKVIVKLNKIEGELGDISKNQAEQSDRMYEVINKAQASILPKATEIENEKE
jgi:hypothetical protein